MYYLLLNVHFESQHFYFRSGFPIPFHLQLKYFWSVYHYHFHSNLIYFLIVVLVIKYYRLWFLFNFLLIVFNLLSSFFNPFFILILFLSSILVTSILVKEHDIFQKLKISPLLHISLVYIQAKYMIVVQMLIREKPEQTL
jgi:hypothetical protein